MSSSQPLNRPRPALHLIVLAVGLGLAGLAAGCSQFGGGVPSSVLPEDSMATILARMHTVDAALYGVLMGGGASIIPERSGANAGVYDALFKRSGTNRATFEASMQYYLQHPQLLDGIYEKALAQMTASAAPDTASSKPKGISPRRTPVPTN